MIHGDNEASLLFGTKMIDPTFSSFDEVKGHLMVLYQAWFKVAVAVFVSKDHFLTRYRFWYKYRAIRIVS